MPTWRATGKGLTSTLPQAVGLLVPPAFGPPRSEVQDFAHREDLGRASWSENEVRAPPASARRGRRLALEEEAVDTFSRTCDRSAETDAPARPIRVPRRVGLATGNLAPSIDGVPTADREHLGRPRSPGGFGPPLHMSMRETTRCRTGMWS